MPDSNPKLQYPGSRRPTFVRRLLKWFATLVVLGIAGVAVLLILMWKEHGTELTLPALTGHFAVGRTTFVWVNDALTDELAPSPGRKREVLVWMWYPAAASASDRPADYLPANWREALERQSGVLMSKILTRDPAVVRTHSSVDPGVSPEQQTYPVVIMRAGGGALTTDFTTLAEDLASHGYVVVGFDAPYRTGVVVFPDGRVAVRPAADDAEGLSAADVDRLAKKILPMWTGDTQFVVDQLTRLNAADTSGRFTGRLDIQRLGMFGHSFGGATALQFCHDDSRCKAGIDIDGDPFGSVVEGGLTQPFLFLLSDHGNLSAPEAGEVMGKIGSIYDHLPEGRLLLMIHGANHFSFSDQILVKSQYVVKPLTFIVRGIDGRRGLAITRDYVHTFFDVHLKDAPANLLDKLRQEYPEVQSIPR